MIEERWQANSGEELDENWLEEMRQALLGEEMVEDRREEIREDRQEERQENNDDMFGNPLRYVWLRIPSTAGGWMDLLHSFWMFLFTTRDFQ